MKGRYVTDFKTLANPSIARMYGSRQSFKQDSLVQPTVFAAHEFTSPLSNFWRPVVVADLHPWLAADAFVPAGFSHTIST